MSEFSAPPKDGVLEQILLVDDNPVNLQILHRTLQVCGYQLLTVNDGAAALDIARKKRPSLILLDIVMPGLDGYTVCQKLKADPATADIAVIFLSALEDSAAKVKGFTVGGVDYISKPFQADEVVARVRNHIKIHRLELELARRNYELESENQQILNAVNEGIIGLDCEGRVTMLNPAAAAITGWSASDALGEPLASLCLFQFEMGQGVADYQSQPVHKYFQAGADGGDIELIARRDGQLLPAVVSSAPLADGGAVIVLRDISEWVDSEEALRLAREELESQRQKMSQMERLSMIGEMAAGIAHEVNQPLTAVANYSGVARRLLDGVEFDKQATVRLLDKINVQSERASEVMQRMRNFLQKPNPSLLVALDINTLLRDVVALAEVDSRINDVVVDLVPGQDLPMVAMDAIQIQQVALNLIRNAMEAMSGSEQSQRGVLVQTELQQNTIFVSVVDHGVGVAEKDVPMLFDPFYTTKKKGMGMGLPICQSIIQRHGGSISFSHNRDGGVTFTFSLPAL